MAQKVNVILVDDIDGSDAVETVSFGLDGTQYEIDLNSGHAEELREQLDLYVKKARKVTGPPAGRAGAAGPAQTTPGTRRYATGPGSRDLDVNERGRIPADIVAQFEAANGK